MKPVDQTIFGSGYAPEGEPVGNCLQAALASILELHLSDVPHFMLLERETKRGWMWLLGEWLAERGLAYLHIPITSGAPRPYQYRCPAHHLMVGPGPRGHRHCVVGLHGQVVHDPHPSHAGLVECDGFGVFVALAPGRMTREAA